MSTIAPPTPGDDRAPTNLNPIALLCKPSIEGDSLLGRGIVSVKGRLCFAQATPTAFGREGAIAFLLPTNSARSLTHTIASLITDSVTVIEQTNCFRGMSDEVACHS
jgi:hypothetical protein